MHIIIIPNNYIVYLLDLIFTIENPISDVKVINNEGVILKEYKAAQINDS